LHEDEWHPVVQKYNRWTSQREVRPNLQISYVRQAYIAPLQANLRITFDSRVSVRRATRFGQVTGLPYLVLHPQWTVLEIKFERLMPEWVDELVHRHGLTNQSVSKYCLGVDRLAMLRQLCGAA
jgi:SPX domain protein involved in polyphosphate accumulation